MNINTFLNINIFLDYFFRNSTLINLLRKRARMLLIGTLSLIESFILLTSKENIILHNKNQFSRFSILGIFHIT